MKLLLFAGLFFAAATCKTNLYGSEPLKDKYVIQHVISDSVSLAGTWRLQPVLPSDTASGIIPSLNFDLNTHRFSGNTGCNFINGNFKSLKDALRFGRNFISTKMACLGYNEKAFIYNLLKTNRCQIKDGVLELMYNSTVLSRWTRHVDTTATKTI